MAQPKAGLAPLGFLFFVPLLLAVENQPRRRVFQAFFLYAFLSSLAILYWIPRVMVRYGGTSWPLGLLGLVCLAAFLAAIAGVAGMAIARLAAAGSTAALALWVPAAWVAKDLVVEKVFGGFPWCLAGTSQQQNLLFQQWAEWGGIHLLSFLLIAANGLIYRLLKKKGAPTAATLVLFLVAVHAGGWLLLRREDARGQSPLRQAGIVQPNSNHDRPFDHARIQSELERLLRISRQLAAQGAEFVVWPEFTVPIYPLQSPRLRSQLDRFGSQWVPLLAGFSDYEENGRVFNSVILFQNNQTEKYDKVHLTPFGEYVPFRRLLFFVRKITDEIGDFTPGTALRNLHLHGRSLSTPICYEIIYPELVRTLVASGGELIVTVSNDSWFGATSAPYQHLAMAALRSIENRRWLLRSTSDGISAVVDPGGRIVRQAPLHREDAFLAPFQFRAQRTLFNRGGYLFPYACAALALLRLLLPRRRRQRFAPGNSR